MLRRAPLHPRNGFTTIESLIAGVVFLVGLAGLLGALVQARTATGQARRLMQATDIANDLAEQIQLWDFNDPRLVVSDPLCADDPLDQTGKLLHPGTGDYNAYKACMNGEVMLTLGGARFGGLQTPVFQDETRDITKNQTRYERYYIVRVQDVRVGVKRMQVWVKVLYMDAGEPRVVTTQTMRIFMGGV
ncbi:MAG: type IV pilus modification PilV family protein [Archangium sp.]